MWGICAKSKNEEKINLKIYRKEKTSDFLISSNLLEFPCISLAVVHFFPFQFSFELHARIGSVLAKDSKTHVKLDVKHLLKSFDFTKILKINKMS